MSTSNLLEQIREYWDEDAPTYDDSLQHRPRDPAVMAAWTAALQQLLGPPARVLDCGAGTGFLSLIAARLGHRVTALDLSGRMLDRLRATARTEGLAIETVEGPAHEPPGVHDVVMERHLLWTLPDPHLALRAWRGAAPTGRLVLVESLWGAADPLARYRNRARRQIERLRRTAPEHHAEYPESLRSALPLGRGTAPSALVDSVTAAGWQRPRLRRLRDVEWAERARLPLPERLVGTSPRLAVVADA